jgi:hypothetical protein
MPGYIRSKVTRASSSLTSRSMSVSWESGAEHPGHGPARRHTAGIPQAVSVAVAKAAAGPVSLGGATPAGTLVLNDRHRNVSDHQGIGLNLNRTLLAV